MTKRYVLAAAAIAVTLATVSARAEPSARSMARHEADYRARCKRDTEKDCSRLPGLTTLPDEQGTVRDAREACARFNASMSTFCTVAADHPPQSRDVLSAVADVISAKMALVKAVAAAKPRP